MTSAQPDFPVATETITSWDGTPIGYAVLGHGPGLLIIHGGAGLAAYFLPLAQLLADCCTVYVMDRRGHGLSGPQGADYRIEQEYADIATLLEHTGVTRVFGHSYGATVALGAALLHPVSRLALYEPGLPVAGPLIGAAKLAAIRSHLERGDALAAYLAFLEGSDVAASLHITEQQLRQHFVTMAAANTSEWQAIVRLLPTLLNEGKAGDHLGPDVSRYAAITADTLLIGGSASHPSLQAVIQALGVSLPRAQTVIVPGEGHSAPTTAPELVAPLLRTFFAANSGE